MSVARAQHALDLLLAMAELRRNTARAILSGETKSTTTLGTDEAPSIVETPVKP